jgi:hypothetical protein
MKTHSMNLYLSHGGFSRCTVSFEVNPIASQYLYEIRKVVEEKTGREVPLREVWENNQKSWVVQEIAKERHGEYAKEHQGEVVESAPAKKRIINRPKKADEML